MTQVNIQKISSYGGDLGYQGYYDYYGYSEDEPITRALVSSPRQRKPVVEQSPAVKEIDQKRESEVA